MTKENIRPKSLTPHITKDNTKNTGFLEDSHLYNIKPKKNKKMKILPLAHTARLLSFVENNDEFTPY